VRENSKWERLATYIERFSDDGVARFDLFPRLKNASRAVWWHVAVVSSKCCTGTHGLSTFKVLLDEPSMGLAPVLVENDLQIIQDINHSKAQLFWLSKMR